MIHSTGVKVEKQLLDDAIYVSPTADAVCAV